MIKALQGSSPGVLMMRILVAAIVVFGTYNPSGKSVYHWVIAQGNFTDAWVILVIVVAALLNLALLIAAWKALGFLGTLIVLILFAALVYLSFQENWVGSSNSIQWMALTLYSVFLGIGLAGAILWRRATGQVVVEDSDDV